jgi:hypothetical protein
VTPRSSLAPRRIALALLVIAAQACSRPQEAPPAVAPTPVAAPPDAGAAAEAGPSPLPVRTAIAMVAEREVALAGEAAPLVDPAVSFRVEVGVPLADGRLTLRDEQDAMVPAAGSTEVGASWTRYRLTPEVPLRPGSTYRLLLDGSSTHSPHDAAGRAFRPLALTVRTAGERPATPPKTRARARAR